VTGCTIKLRSALQPSTVFIQFCLGFVSVVGVAHSSDSGDLSDGGLADALDRSQNNNFSEGGGTRPEPDGGAPGSNWLEPAAYPPAGSSDSGVPDAFVDDWDDIELEGSYEDEGFDADAEYATTILGSEVNAKRIAGSAHRVTNKELEKLEYDDVHRILKQVPGVYVRDEDGYGLRPNIGLRGANSDRSSKITLMEDGVLLSPAPYAAPAAYYFPLSTRLYGLEIFKGPASIKHGPNTIGGAMNLLTRPAPSRTQGAVDLSAGAYDTQKLHGHFGTGGEHYGILLEGVRLQSGGFKDLPSSHETGFNRSDFMLKARLNSGYEATVYHALEVKLGYGNENSHETYLGLSDADFNHMPRQRYAASQNDFMQWHRTQLQSKYSLTWEDHLEVKITGYRHDFDRSWNRFNRFQSGPDVSTILANPDAGQLAIYHRLLKGSLNSETNDQYLMMVDNHRRFVSQGVQSLVRVGFDIWKIRQDIEMGLRIHQDQVDRYHLENAYAMDRGNLLPVHGYSNLATDNLASAIATSAYIYDEIVIGDLLIGPGVRFELIYTSLDDTLNGQTDDALRFAWLPGIGASYQIFDFFNILAGVHRGFSPVAPGQDADVQPEQSINYEGGMRLDFDHTTGEWIGFFNQYSNLTGECTFSQGCANDVLGDQFNAGAVNVFGFEALTRHGLEFWNLRYQVDLAYTFTLSHFLADFSSPNPQYGDVKAGDALPYVPMHQASAVLGLYGQTFDLTGSLTYASPMRDVAGQGPMEEEEMTDAYWLVDFMTTYHFNESSHLYFRVDNLLNYTYVSSRRPYGVRPGKPLQYMIGYKQSFGT
jgi:Fe(3+) dicitrate transport protein